jgi:general secretion pathway protein A
MYSLREDSPERYPDAPASTSLIYEPFYGLREKPFSLSADPRFLFRSPAHGPAFDELLAGIRRREGLIVLTGEIGTGKTTVCRSVLGQLDRRTFAAFVADPFVSREDLLKTLLVDFGVISIGDLTRGRFTGATRSDLSYPLYEFLDSLVPLQAFAVVVIDEAQNLSLPLLEEIRILSELERREKLLQVVLVGQPELRSSLRLPQMRQVDQRVSVRTELTALDAEGVSGYVAHRLGVASLGRSRAAFTSEALAAVYDGSSGVPRLINRICDRALQRAYVARSLQIDERFVRAATEDLGLSLARASRGAAEIETPPPASERPVLQAPALTPAPAAVVITDLAVAPTLADFAAEADQPALVARRPGYLRLRTASGAGAAAAVLAIVASLGAAAWYVGAQPVESETVAALLPPRPAGAFARPVALVPEADPAVPDLPQVPHAVPPAAAAPAAGGDYTILVASFDSRTRADRLVEELVSAGYRARALERDWGPPRGRMVQVEVGGYASASDVQRDLQNIRELPGNYSDARVVERQ